MIIMIALFTKMHKHGIGIIIYLVIQLTHPAHTKKNSFPLKEYY